MALVRIEEPTFEIYEVDPADGPLADQLARLAAKARGKGFRMVATGHAMWCPANKALVVHAADPRMKEAYAGVLLVLVGVDDPLLTQADALGLPMKSIPTLQPVAPDGTLHGPTLPGDAWGADVPERMAPVLRAYFDGLPAPPAPEPPAAAPPAAAQSRARTIALAILALVLIGGGAWWKVSYEERQAKEQWQREQNERIQRDVQKSIQKNLNKKNHD
jgi:hypothetical protein